MQPIALYRREPVNEYRLIIDPPAAVKQKILALQEIIEAQNGGTVSKLQSPFIFLATFQQAEEEELQMTDALYSIALGFMPFKVHLKNFKPLDGNEVYIAIEDQRPLELLHTKLKTAKNCMQQERFNQLPRISLSRNLPPILFEQSWRLVEEKTFSATFIASAMLLLKKMPGFRSWQVLKHLEFQNQLLTPV